MRNERLIGGISTSEIQTNHAERSHLVSFLKNRKLLLVDEEVGSCLGVRNKFENVVNSNCKANIKALFFLLVTPY